MKVFKCILMICICILLVPNVAMAGPVENMLPDQSPVNDDGAITDELYETFDVDAYKFDGSFGIMEIFDKSVNSILGGLYVTKTFGMKIALYIFQWSFYFPLFDDLATWIGEAVEWMGGDLFRSFLSIVSVFISTWMLIELFRRRYADSFKSLGISVLFLGLSMVLFNNMGDVLKFVNDFSDEASAEIMALQQSEDNKKAVMVKLGNKIWENYVIIPWQFGEFGSSMKPGSPITKDSKDPIARDTYLILSADSDQRENLVKTWADEKYPTMTDRGITGRGVVVIVGSVTDFLFAVFLITFSLFYLFYRLAFLVLAFMAPVVCLFAAWPRAGIWTVINWLKNWLGAGLYGVVVTLLLMFYLGISSQLYLLVPKMGWFFGGVVPQLVLIVMLVIFRKQIIQVFTTPVKQTRNFYRTSKSLIDKNEPLATQKKMFGQQINQAFDNAEKMIKNRLRGQKEADSVSASTQSTHRGFSKPYLQGISNQSYSNNQSSSKKVDGIDPEVIPPKQLNKGVHKPDIIDAEFEEVKEQETPKLPKKGRLVNGQFIALPAPAPKNKKKLIQLTDQQKQQLKIAAAQFVTKKIMEKVKK
ncbi:hypothetical protein [Thermoactinomyces vulgaris]|uniref:hypothetical protein n=1 Tax=Thermoactinomyces vulgaris TaxID=2026 RepID=UPI00362D38BD